MKVTLRIRIQHITRILCINKAVAILMVISHPSIVKVTEIPVKRLVVTLALVLVVIAENLFANQRKIKWSRLVISCALHLCAREECNTWLTERFDSFSVQIFIFFSN